jgi:hypothetical protein
MLTQRLEADQATNSGKLTITCPVGGLAELMGLAEELRLRSTVITEGTIVQMKDLGGDVPQPG